MSKCPECGRGACWRLIHPQAEAEFVPTTRFTFPPGIETRLRKRIGAGWLPHLQFICGAVSLDAQHIVKREHRRVDRAERARLRHLAQQAAALLKTAERELVNEPHGWMYWGLREDGQNAADVFQVVRTGLLALEGAAHSAAEHKIELVPGRPPADETRAVLHWATAVVVQRAGLHLTKAETGKYARILKCLYEAVGEENRIPRRATWSRAVDRARSGQDSWCDYEKFARDHVRSRGY
jgi:hypothetical protein